MTEPKGRVFISYKRSRIEDVTILVNSLRLKGIPVWQDVHNLPFEHTDSEIRRVLEAHDEISGAILWISEDYDQSPIIEITEVPGIFKRVENQDGFYVCPVAADSLGYEKASLKAGKFSGTGHVNERNMLKASMGLNELEANQISSSILNHRVEKVLRTTPDLIQVSFNTKVAQAHNKEGLCLDWSHYFSAGDASEEAWAGALIPALKDVGRALSNYIEKGVVSFSGFISLPTAIVMGAIFSSTRGIKISWTQKMPAMQGEQKWSLSETRIVSNFSARLKGSQLSESGLAVIISVSSDATVAFSNSKNDLPKFKAILEIAPKDNSSYHISNAGEALDVAMAVREGILKARSDYKGFDKIHFFTSAPVGLAVMIGQLLNTFGEIQTYEYNPKSGGGIYKPSVSFNASEMHL